MAPTAVAELPPMGRSASASASAGSLRGLTAGIGSEATGGGASGSSRRGSGRQLVSGPIARSPMGGRSQSEAQLRRSSGGQRCSSIPLPPIMKAPRPHTFEDLLVSAKLRVAKKAAKDRKGGTAPHLYKQGSTLPDFPRGLGQFSSYFNSQAQEDPEMQAWAASTLDGIPGEESDLVPQQSEDNLSLPSRECPKRRQSQDSAAGAGAIGATASQEPSARKPSKASMRKKTQDLADDAALTSGQKHQNAAYADIDDPELVELLDTIAARCEGRAEGFTPKELERMEYAFSRFKIPGESDLYICDIPDLLGYLGHALKQEDKVLSVARQVTMFDYLDFDEYITFMEQFLEFEKEEFRRIFDLYDEDGSGEISVKELRALTKELGFCPLRQMVDESLKIVDRDGNGQLNFEELCTFLAVYQRAEGFTRAEVEDLQKQFNFFSEVSGPNQDIRMLPPDALSDALVQVFGLQVTPFSRKMQERLASGQGLQKSSFDKGGGEPEPINFAEFLIFARKLREEVFLAMSAEHSAWSGIAGTESQGGALQEREEFSKRDLDGSGGVSEQELRKVLLERKYTPLRAVLDEIFEEIVDGEWDPDLSELDFEEFFDFMLVFEQRDGFTRQEVAELRKVYERFDEDNSGEVSSLECAELFRYVGYRVTLEDIRDSVVEVDENGSGQLDFREFLRLMRLYREKELAKIKAVFEKYVDKTTGTADQRGIDIMLVALGHDPPFEYPPGMADETSFNFDDLVTVADCCRSAFVAKERKKAGFSDEEIEYFNEIYIKFDTNKNGEIDNLELQNILKEFGWQPKSKDEQQELMRKLDIARNLAREAGVLDVGPDGSPFIKFWSFIQLARMLRTQQDKNEERSLRELQTQLNFSEGEVEDFRQIFRGWVKKSYGLEAKSPPKLSDNTPETLSRDMLRRLVRSLGISISPVNADRLDAQIQALDEEKRVETACLGFSGFLKLMRWMLDIDFAGISDATAKASETAKPATPAAAE